MGCKPFQNSEEKTLAKTMKNAYKNGISALLINKIVHSVVFFDPVIFARFEAKQNSMIRSCEKDWKTPGRVLAFFESAKPNRGFLRRDL